MFLVTQLQCIVTDYKIVICLFLSDSDQLLLHIIEEYSCYNFEIEFLFTPICTEEAIYLTLSCKC